MASNPPPAPQVTPYWPALVIGGNSIDLSHLEPFKLSFESERLKRTLIVDITFSNHCFTDHFKDGVHDPTWKIMDHKRERVFCYTRHSMSLRLPSMVQSLPKAKVTQSRQDRNYIYVTTIDDGSGNHYPMFFKIERERTRHHDLKLVVESAYTCTVGDMKRKLEGGRSVAFAVLCANLFENRQARPNGRR